MLEYFYYSIILIGITSLLVTFYYNKIFKSLRKLLSNLMKLQAYRDEDLEEYIAKVLLHVRELGITDICYELHFLNSSILKKSSEFQTTKNILTKEVKSKHISGEITIVVQSNRGEKRVINQLILYVITLQITNTIHTYINSINESFEHVAKLQTYMMHDLKNILQFFQAMQYNVENIKNEAEGREFIDFLQNSTEPINHKVNKILALLKLESQTPQTYIQKDVDLRALLLEYLEYYKLSAKVEGECFIFLNEEYLRTILENLLGNIYDKSIHEKKLYVEILITKKENICNILIKDSGKKFENPTKVFEPFYSTKAGGIGIGMYQVQSLIELLGGEISCYNEDEKPTTNINFYLK